MAVTFELALWPMKIHSIDKILNQLDCNFNLKRLNVIYNKCIGCCTEITEQCTWFTVKIY